jgi:hypothetical protein
MAAPTEAQIVLIDIALKKYRVGHAIPIQSVLHNAMIGIHDKYPQELANQINEIYIRGGNEIRDILLEEKYTTCVDRNKQFDILTEKGEDAKREGGHKEYLAWKAIQ